MKKINHESDAYAFNKGPQRAEQGSLSFKQRLALILAWWVLHCKRLLCKWTRAPGEAMGQGDVPGEWGPGLAPVDGPGPVVPSPSLPLLLLSQGALCSPQEARNRKLPPPATRNGSKATYVP